MAKQQGELEKIFAEIRQKRGAEFAITLRGIFDENGSRGRVDWYLEQSDSHTICLYVDKLTQQYDEEHEYIEALQKQKDTAVWQEMHQQVQRRAYLFLLQLNFTKQQSMALSGDVAQDACLEILFAYYPYDSDMEAWVTTLVKNVTRKRARQVRRDEKNQTDLEKTEYDPNFVSSAPNKLAVELEITEEELNEAIQQLSELQQEVIIAHYLSGLPLADFAEETGVNRNTIYKRHHDALKKLRKILGQDEH